MNERKELPSFFAIVGAHDDYEGEEEEVCGKKDVDAVMDGYERKIKELRYERTMWKAKFFREREHAEYITSYRYVADVREHYIKRADKCKRIAETLETRAIKLKEAK